MKEIKPCFLLLVSFILSPVCGFQYHHFLSVPDAVPVSAQCSGSSAVMHAMSGQPADVKGNI